MAQFVYQAIDTQNKHVKGNLEAQDISQAKTRLRQSGLYITAIRKESSWREQFGLESVKNLDLAVFSHQFSVMISSGIPLIRSLQALSEETTNRRFRNIIDKIRFDVENGASLSSALSKHNKIFSNFFISLIKSGEAAGIMPLVLHRLADHLEKEEDLRRKVKASFAYPSIVAVTAFGVVSFLLIFIVPVFRKVYKTLRIELPGPTTALIVLSNIFIKFWWLVLVLIAMVYFFLRVAKGHARFGLYIDRFKLKLPIFGPLNRKVALSRFVRTLSTMVASGLTLSTSLIIVKDVVSNKVVGNSVEAITKDINQGRQLSDALKAQSFFPPIVVQMISVGEESGNLTAMLDKCADFLDENIDTLIKSLVVKLEPILTFSLAVLVGFIALAIYLPMFDLIHQINR